MAGMLAVIVLLQVDAPVWVRDWMDDWFYGADPYLIRLNDLRRRSTVDDESTGSERHTGQL